jgi:uncharacterized RDD family membrane protein YckC
MGSAPAYPPATAVDRIVATFIDGLIAIPIGLIGIIPIVGQIVSGVALGCYWLFRDAKGFSIGKKVMKLQVISKNGGPATPDQMTKRNIPLCIGAFLSAIPIIGWFLGIVQALALIIELIFLLTKGERYGDQMASTTVVKLPG